MYLDTVFEFTAINILNIGVYVYLVAKNFPWNPIVNFSVQPITYGTGKNKNKVSFCTGRYTRICPKSVTASFARYSKWYGSPSFVFRSSVPASINNFDGDNPRWVALKASFFFFFLKQNVKMSSMTMTAPDLFPPEELHQVKDFYYFS